MNTKVMSQDNLNRKLEQYRTLSEKYSLIRLAGKRPIEKNWQRFCLEHRAFEEIGFKPWDNAGIACGPASGIIVLDIDNEKLFQRAQQRHNWSIPDTRIIRTGSGGIHYYFRYPQDEKRYGNAAQSTKQGFDIRGNGGCVVVLRPTIFDWNNLK